MGMCITALLMELWETLFAACGKVPFTFPCAVNGVSHDGIGSYAHFHNAKVFSLCLFSVTFPYPPASLPRQSRNSQKPRPA